MGTLINYFEELNHGINIDVLSLYFRYSGSFPYFLSADASRKGSPLTKTNRNVVQRGPIIVHNGAPFVKQNMKIPNQRTMFPK